jgi:hypothetical protein
MFTITLSAAQAETGDLPDENIRLFIGLSRGNLTSDNEDDLRAFAVLQELVKSIRGQLADRVTDIRTGDLLSWIYTDWEKLSKLPITHYLIAHATKRTANEAKEVEVEWHLGRFPAGSLPADRKPLYAGLIRQRTFIKIDGEQTTVEQSGSNGRIPFNDRSESAETIVKKLRTIFPEMRREHY